eukprot:CAMPEP_0181331936 /NCGR_PEP_ID=MMETSP1101-20121128/24801_1 /TAXON_ID=46948 /ORGANISM="Rhodomonas abbreviata, Strain Caron Lab Isolate" /LENGTH=118 /DNA_ID=CAMNT_0023441497 /DNA_START=74 /DNA_END=430 /DNA_ORIENTATION=+
MSASSSGSGSGSFFFPPPAGAASPPAGAAASPPPPPPPPPPPLEMVVNNLLISCFFNVEQNRPGQNPSTSTPASLMMALILLVSISRFSSCKMRAAYVHASTLLSTCGSNEESALRDY